MSRAWPRSEHTPHQPDELTPEQRDRMCPSCRIRYRTHTPSPRELFGPLDIDRFAYRWLQNAARVWDSQSDETFPAADFIAWIRFDLAGQHPFHGDHDGAPSRTESGGFGNHDSATHRHPFPLAQVELPPKLRKIG